MNRSKTNKLYEPGNEPIDIGDPHDPIRTVPVEFFFFLTSQNPWRARFCSSLIDRQRLILCADWAVGESWAVLAQRMSETEYPGWNAQLISITRDGVVIT